MTAFILLALPAAFAGKQVNTSIWTDTDGDGVIDALDLCAGTDDSVDLDSNGVADCSETFVVGAAFDYGSQVTPWERPGSVFGEIGWASNHDGAGWASSGSLHLYVSPSRTLSDGMSECIAVSGNTSHVFLANYKLVSDDPNPRTDIYLYEFSSASKCNSISGAAVDHSFHETGTTGWDVMGSRFTTRSSTRYMRIYVRTLVQAGGGTTAPVRAYYDNILLHDTPEELEQVSISER